MIRGTRIIIGAEAAMHSTVCEKIRSFLLAQGYVEVILPALWEQETFVKKAGPEIVDQMYTFADRKGRPICLVPEATAMVQELWNNEWRGAVPHPHKVFYIQRCYRYERPQAGRYREFTQAGVEILGGDSSTQRDVTVRDLRHCLTVLDVDFVLNESVKRGLHYYVEDGFEAEVTSLGAQKQVAGGGRYAEGVGWAIGVDRVVLAKMGKM